VIHYVRLPSADMRTWGELISSDFRRPGGPVLTLTLKTPSRTEEIRKFDSEFCLNWSGVKESLAFQRITYDDVT